MSDVISIDLWREENSPHNAGMAKCLVCGHREVTVAPTGVVFMECSECHCERKVYELPVEREGKHWYCQCGNAHFLITPDGVYCPNCGDWQRGF